jgi:hypothetical protein
MHVPARLAPLAMLVSLACNAGSTAQGGDGTDEGASSDPTNTGSGAGSDGSGGTGVADDSGGESGTPVGDVPARGIRISLVEANPGVAIPVARDGAWVGGGERNAPIVKGRDTAFRVYVDIDEAVWVPRDIEARITVSQPDAREAKSSVIVNVDQDSSVTSLQSNFLLGVLAEDMQPGAKFQVELFEAGDGWQSLPEPATPPRAIDAGADFIGVEGTEQTMKLVIVPVAYDFGGCQSTPDLTTEALQPYEDAMYQQNPLEHIEIEVRAPLPVSDLDLTDSNDFFALLNRVVQLRAQDGPEPNVYYYALFDNCGACIGEGGGCLLGVAPGTPGSSQGEASQRAAIGVRYLSGSEVGIETFVHEIGHTQGRAHVACPSAQSAGPDPSYPYEGGSIGVWGFGVRDFSIHNPSNHTDYMSYCNPTWVSDWQWNATFKRIQALTEWDALKVAPPQTTILVGTLNPETGESNFWTERGFVEPQDTAGSPHTLALVAGDIDLHSTAADVDAWSEGPWVTVRANLPAEAMIAGSDAFELRMPERTARIARERVRFDLAASMRAPAGD